MTGFVSSATPYPNPANNSVKIVIGALSPGPVPPLPSAEIPTLSQSGAIILALLLATLGLLRSQGRRG